MELTAYTDKHKLPYYDKIEFDEHGWLVTPPGFVSRPFGVTVTSVRCL
jgi:hypothetical protein